MVLMVMKRVPTTAMTLSLLLLLGASPDAAPRPEYLPLDAPYSSRDTVAAAVNDRGQVVGGYWDREAGFLWDRGTYRLIHVPGGVSNGLSDAINDRGQVVGEYRDAQGRFHGFLLRGAVYTTLDFPHSTETDPEGINDHGQVVGQYQDHGGHRHGFLWSGGVWRRIDVPHSTETDLKGINDRGQIVGLCTQGRSLVPERPDWHGFLLTGRVFTPIAPPHMARLSNICVNGRGQVAGSYEDASGDSHGFLWDGGTAQTLDFPSGGPPPADAFGPAQTQVRGMNDQGDLVGNETWRVNGMGGDFHAFVWHRHVYRRLFAPDHGFAYAINAAGQIAGSYVDAQGGVHGFLTRPR